MFEYMLVFFAPQIDMYGNVTYISATRAGADDPEDLGVIMCYYTDNHMEMTIYDEYGQAYHATNAQIQDSSGNCFRAYTYLEALSGWAIG